MAKSIEKRDLMVQKINLSKSMLLIWENNLRRLLNVAIHKYKIDESDIHKHFDVLQPDGSNRTFSIEGITDEDYTILKEYTETGELYWMCKYEYAQYLMGRLNNKIKYDESTDKKTKVTKVEITLKPKEYTDAQLYLPNKHTKRNKSEEEKIEVNPEMTDDIFPFLFEDDEDVLALEFDEYESESIIE
jgi:hypothetical protein